MHKYREIVSKLQTKGVLFELGMSSSEIAEIEKLYDIYFPSELKGLYSVGLPVSSGFYNWRDVSVDNVECIKKTLKRPILGLQTELENDFGGDGFPHDDFWYDGWGDKPNNFNQAYKILLTHYNNAPKLIPIYGHRYMPFIQNSEEAPVFSIIGSDIIYYGENLISYLETEFKLREYNNDMKCQHIDFWSDLL